MAAVTADDRVALVRLLTEAVPAGDEGYVDAVVDPGVVLPELPGGGQGREGYKAGLRAYAAGVTYSSIAAEDVVADGDKIAARLVVRGTHTGELLGIAATNREFQIDQVVVAQFRDGRVVRFWNVADRLSLLHQLRGGVGS